MSDHNITLSQDFQMRYTESSDEPYLKAWLSQPQIMQWFSVCDTEEIEEMVKIWIGYAKFKCSLTATYQGVPCAIGTLFLMPYIKLIHQSMVYLVVDPKHHHQHIGTSLIRNLDHLASVYFKLERMHYEVFGDNPLTALLQKQGYVALFSQPKYVKLQNGYMSRTILEKVFKS